MRNGTHNARTTFTQPVAMAYPLEARRLSAFCAPPVEVRRLSAFCARKAPTEDWTPSTPRVPPPQRAPPQRAYKPRQAATPNRGAARKPREVLKVGVIADLMKYRRTPAEKKKLPETMEKCNTHGWKALTAEEKSLLLAPIAGLPEIDSNTWTDEEKEQVPAILRKISKKGWKGLTDEEKALLLAPIDGLPGIDSDTWSDEIPANATHHHKSRRITCNLFPHLSINQSQIRALHSMAVKDRRGIQKHTHKSSGFRFGHEKEHPRHRHNCQVRLLH